MRIEIWSDVVCPWCYIGKRRLETALSAFDHADEVEVVWRSYQLDPTAPVTPTQTVAEHLAAAYGGGPAAGQEMVDRMVPLAAAEGLVFRNGEAAWVGTLDAHRLLHLALADGGPERQGRLKEALFAAYFTEARNVADPSVLRELAVSVGLDAGRVEGVLASDAYADEVAADIAHARAYGATGVPFVVVDQRYGVSGAQSAEVFGQVLQQAWADAHPGLQLTPAGETCGPDGCAI